MTDIVTDFYKNILIGGICSKVEGRRNWIIRTQEYNGMPYVYFKGGMGEAIRRGITSEYVGTIAKNNVQWFCFTYKKDYLKALQTLKELGYKNC